eukprot:285067-Rhodomonas_salina.1
MLLLSGRQAQACVLQHTRNTAAELACARNRASLLLFLRCFFLGARARVSRAPGRMGSGKRRVRGRMRGREEGRSGGSSRERIKTCASSRAREPVRESWRMEEEEEGSMKRARTCSSFPPSLPPSFRPSLPPQAPPFLEWSVRAKWALRAMRCGGEEELDVRT